MNFFREATFFRTHLCILLAGKECLLPLVFLLAFSQRIFLDFSTMPPHRLRMTPHRLRMPSSSLLKTFFSPFKNFLLPSLWLPSASLHP